MKAIVTHRLASAIEAARLLGLEWEPLSFSTAVCGRRYDAILVVMGAQHLSEAERVCAQAAMGRITTWLKPGAEMVVI